MELGFPDSTVVTKGDAVYSAKIRFVTEGVDQFVKGHFALPVSAEIAAAFLRKRINREQRWMPSAPDNRHIRQRVLDKTRRRYCVLQRRP